MTRSSARASLGWIALIFIIVLSSATISGAALAHTQLGSDIFGDPANGVGVASVSLSWDGQRLAVTLPLTIASGAQREGARVFEWSGSAWQQLGADFVPFVSMVSLSADGNRVAVYGGRVRVFEWSGSAWQQLGAEIATDGTWEFLDRSLSLSADGRRLAVDTRNLSTNVSQARVFEWSGSAWQQLGAALDIETGVGSEIFVSLTGDGSRLAVGSPTYSTPEVLSVGRSQVFEWSDAGWQQLGAAVQGEAYRERLGTSVALSTDGQRLAIGIPDFIQSDGPGGKVRVLEWSGSSWQQLGAAIEGNAARSEFGQSVSLDATGGRLAVGAPSWSATDRTGRVRVFGWLMGAWRQLGGDIIGNPHSGFGNTVSLGAEGSFVAVAAYYGYASVWLIEATPAPTLAGLEVVQVVQDWRNSAPLVAGKDTVVRAHLAAAVATPIPSNVVARLDALDAQGQPLNPPFIRNGPNQAGENLQLPLVVDPTTRASLYGSVNFYLPPEWLQPGTRTFRFESSTAQVWCTEQAPPTANDCAVSVTFQPRQRIVLQALRTQFQDVQSTPTECASTGGEYVGGICTYLTSSTDLTAVCRQIQKQLPTHEVSCGLVTSTIFFPSANDRPTSTEILGEVVRRKRARCPLCDDFYMAVTAFSSGDGFAGQGPFAANPKRDDHRTSWAVEDSRDSDAATHEIGHNLGLRHPAVPDSSPGDGIRNGTCGEVADEEYSYPPGQTPYFPYYHADSLGNLPRLGPILPSAAQTLVFGFDSGSRRVIGHDAMALMSYCQQRERWLDIGSYGALFAALAPPASASTSTTSTNSSPYFWVSGSWNRTTDAAHFDPIEIATPPVAPTVPAAGSLDLLVHFNAAPDIAQPLAPSASPNDPNQFTFYAWVPHSPAVIGFTLRRNGIAIAHTQASAHAPQLAISGPAPGGSYIGQDLTLSWSASDADGDPLVFRIEYSADGGISWAMLSSAWPASPFVASTDLLESTPTALFRVTALDGFLSTTATMAGPIAVYGSTIFGDGFE
jgi:hypothetical protein